MARPCCLDELTLCLVSDELVFLHLKTARFGFNPDRQFRHQKLPTRSSQSRNLSESSERRVLHIKLRLGLRVRFDPRPLINHSLSPHKKITLASAILMETSSGTS